MLPNMKARGIRFPCALQLVRRWGRSRGRRRFDQSANGSTKAVLAVTNGG